MLQPFRALKIVIVTVTCVFLIACGGGKSNSVIPTPQEPAKTKRFSHVKMHYDLLKNQSMIFGELGSLPPYTSLTRHITTTSHTSKGSTSLHIQDNSVLFEKQLIVYLSEDGIYHVAQIKKLNNSGEISLFQPIKNSIAKGNNVWDFYGNASHANSYGFKAIADFAIKSLNFGPTTEGNHLLFGDSWFDEGSIHNRLIQKLPLATIINRGIGGNTTQDLIKRFDTDVTPYAPNYIWIISGTNDYWGGISTAQYKENLNILINKSKAIGAKVIIIDSSVGEGIGATNIQNQLQSEEYVKAVNELNL